MNSDKLKRNEHPGWAVSFEDNTWLGGAHGWFRSEDAFYADTFKTKEEAEKWLKYYIEDYEKNNCPKGSVVVAWEPMCQHLLFDIQRLKQANKITPSRLSDIEDALENAINYIKDASEELKK